jgi:hypothetical protein
VGRAYSGVLGHVGFLTSLAQGCVQGGSTQAVLLHAWLCLLAFAAIGYVTGRLAGWVVEESVRAKLSAELAAAPAGTQAPREASA